jgi:hypothetical protein
MKANGAKINAVIWFFDQANRDADFNDSDRQRSHGKAVLRSRFFFSSRRPQRDTNTSFI